jgi:hypothetical protein
LKRLVAKTASDYGVSFALMNSIIECESGYVSTIQSHYRYTKDRPHEGVVAGQREQSFGLVQIHLPAHPGVSYQEAIDPQFAIEFLASGLAQGQHNMWSCYRQIAMR